MFDSTFFYHYIIFELSDQNKSVWKMLHYFMFMNKSFIILYEWINMLIFSCFRWVHIYSETPFAQQTCKSVSKHEQYVYFMRFEYSETRALRIIHPHIKSRPIFPGESAHFSVHVSGPYPILNLLYCPGALLSPSGVLWYLIDHPCR